MCVSEAHPEHDAVEADVLYKKKMEEIRDLETAIDSKMKRQSDVKAKLETMRQQIFQSYEKVDIIQDMVYWWYFITKANHFARHTYMIFELSYMCD